MKTPYSWFFNVDIRVHLFYRNCACAWLALANAITNVKHRCFTDPNAWLSIINNFVPN